MDRRRFVKTAGAAAGAMATGACAPSLGAARPRPTNGTPEIIVIGAGAFGAWTALHLQRAGHRVTLVDQYGPGNSRATSGEETRGIRTGYGDNELWSGWARQAIERWKSWDAEWGTKMFTQTGDICMRPDWDNFLSTTTTTWERVGVRYERVTADEVMYRYPQFEVSSLPVGVFEPDAGVARARYTILTLADQFQKLGGDIVLGRAEMGASVGGVLSEIQLEPANRLSAQSYVFALGPWFPKAMPALLGDHIRIPMGHVFYYGAPPGDLRFNHPSCPSYNFPGVTGWPILDHDSRGFRVRTGGRPPEDPDLSIRWIDEEYHEVARRVLVERFPALADAPLLETRSCHYEISSTGNFIIDRHPDFSNVWVLGGGSAEGFKFGPIIGDYASRRITGEDDDQALAANFRLPA